LTRRGSYRIDDWLHFVDCNSAYVFRKAVLGERLYALWQLLVTAVMHFCRPDTPDPDLDIEEQRAVFDTERETAADALREFANQIQTMGFPLNMFTMNLHTCVCG
jgi:hypothetical protein